MAIIDPTGLAADEADYLAERIADTRRPQPRTIDQARDLATAIINHYAGRIADPGEWEQVADRIARLWTPRMWAAFARHNSLPAPTTAVQAAAVAIVRLHSLDLNSTAGTSLIPPADQRPTCVRAAWLHELTADQLRRLQLHQDDEWKPATPELLNQFEPWTVVEIRETTPPLHAVTDTGDAA